MKTWQFSHTIEHGWQNLPDFTKLDSPQTLVLAFCSPLYKNYPDVLRELSSFFPNSILTGCSTSGEILDDKIHDYSISVTVIRLESSSLRFAKQVINDKQNSGEVGQTIAKELQDASLRGILVLSDGLMANGSSLIEGINRQIDSQKVSVSGGLAGDGDRFEKTWVLDRSEAVTGLVVGIGFYGDDLAVSTAMKGGWDIFGPERKVTRSVGNVLYELDGKPALDLYKQYLGDQAKALPASALLFPLQIRSTDSSQRSLVRTILSVNDADKSMAFAGDIPQGCRAQLMKANFERLIDGASQAAEEVKQKCESRLSQLSKSENLTVTIAISCVGRRLVLGERAEEEVETLKAILNKNSTICGFFSYGEIAPHRQGAPCDLHNQSMTLMSIFESKNLQKLNVA